MLEWDLLHLIKYAFANSIINGVENSHLFFFHCSTQCLILDRAILQ